MPRNVALHIIRGILANMPILEDGEFYFATDEYQLYVGFNGDAFPIGSTMAVQIQDAVSINKLSVNPYGSAAIHVTDNNSNNSLQIWADGSLVVNSGANKTLVMKTGQLTTNNSNAGQVILTYTTTANQIFYLEYIDIQARLANTNNNASILGTVTFTLAAVPCYMASFVSPSDSDAGSQSIRLSFGEPLPIPASTVVSVLVTPAGGPQTLWIANFGGFER